ncbi:MAG TPA: exo-alpha-sialidase, partial [Burkholderiaceae bacterium]
FELQRAASGWRIANVSFLAEPVTMVLPPPPGGGRMFAALNLGHFGVKLHGSDDGGKTWSELAAPAYPPQPEGAEGPPWALKQVWAMERADGAIWAGTIPGGLFRSVDEGASWQLIESLWQRKERLEWFGGGYDAPGIHSICPYPGRAGEMLLGISCGGAWRTTDGGANWDLRAAGMQADFMPPERKEDQNIQDPHAIARCSGAPDVLWTQHHCGIWRSSDNGASWQQLHAQPASFGFAVAVHPQDGSTAWFAPAQKDERRVPVDGALCVTRTRDGGKSFEVLRAGLPQQDCYDIIYRHGLAVDATGTQLLMGSTTGKLWASANAGDSWTLPLPHLPPIYAVKFG